MTGMEPAGSILPFAWRGGGGENGLKQMAWIDPLELGVAFLGALFFVGLVMAF